MSDVGPGYNPSDSQPGAKASRSCCFLILEEMCWSRWGEINKREGGGIHEEEEQVALAGVDAKEGVRTGHGRIEMYVL